MKDESIEPNTKKLIFAEFEKKCREANTLINDSISKNQDELEKQIVKKSLSNTNIDFDTLLWKVDGNIFEKSFLPLSQIQQKNSLQIAVY